MFNRNCISSFLFCLIMPIVLVSLSNYLHAQCTFLEKGKIFNGVECTELIRLENGDILIPYLPLVESCDFVDFSIGDDVEFSYTIMDEGFSVCQQGQIAEIICIRKENEGDNLCATLNRYESCEQVNGVSNPQGIKNEFTESETPHIWFELAPASRGTITVDLTLSNSSNAFLDFDNQQVFHEFSFESFYYTWELGNLPPEVYQVELNVSYTDASAEVQQELLFFEVIEELNCTVGDSCDDMNDCTTGETLDSNCDCTGGVFQDADNDGVCDDEDDCPSLNNSLIGMPCDDGNSNTDNDSYNSVSCMCEGQPIVYDCEGLMKNQGDPCDDVAGCRIGGTINSSCDCEGFQIVDADGDGICDAEDTCPNFDNGMIDQPCDDGDDCTVGERYDTSCNCSGGVFMDSDNDGICDADELDCPTLGGNQGEPCGGVADCSTAGIIDDNCDCIGSEIIDADNDGVCDANDTCPNFDNGMIDMPCDDGDACTVGERYDANCGCSGGVFMDSDNDGICDADELDCPMLGGNQGEPCGEVANCSTAGIIDDNCNCIGSEIIDADNDGVCDANDTCPNFDNGMIDMPCDDGDACTVGERYDANCGCSGGVFMDSDNDGICDADDDCPNLNDTMIGAECDDGDPSTENDRYTNDCECEGIPKEVFPSTSFIEDTSGEIGDIVEIFVKANGFVDKNNFEVSISFDSLLFGFDQILSVTNNIENYSDGNIIFIEPNTIVSSWVSTDFESVVDGEVLFSFGLEVLSSNCDDTQIEFNEVLVAVSDFGGFPSSTTNGTIKLNQNENEPCEETCETLAAKNIVTLTNIISPANRDNFNDVLRFTEDNVIEDSRLTILNRWGNVVFEQDNYNSTWSAEGHPAGVYFYIFELNEFDLVCKSTLTVVK